jgi:hypothetical protein
LDGIDSRVHARNEWLRVGFQLSLWWQTSDDRLDEERTEAGLISRAPIRATLRGFQHNDSPFFVQGAGNEMREGLRCDLTLFFHTVHVDPES